MLASDRVLEPCPLNGTSSSRAFKVSQLPKEAVKTVTDLVSGATYLLHFCIDVDPSRIALPLEKLVRNHVERRVIIHQISTGWAMSWKGFEMIPVKPHHLGLAPDPNEDDGWSHFMYLLPA